MLRPLLLLVSPLTAAAGSYLAVLRLPRVGWPAVGAVVAALPVGMLGLSVLLMVQHTNADFAAAGLVVGFLGLGTGVGMAVQGRLIDRWGQPPVLLGAAGVQLSGAIGLVIATHVGAGLWWLALLAAVTGAGEPQVVASLRALWPGLVPDELRRVATATSTLLFEAPVLAGPLLLAVLLTVVSPAAAVIGASACFVTGAVVMSSSSASRAWNNTVRRTSLLGSLASPSIRTVVAVAAGQGLLTGFLQVPAAAAAAAAGVPSWAGLLYAALSAGSLLGAAAFGVRRPSTSAVRTLRLLLLGVTGSAAAAALAPTLPVLAAALLVIGACLGPTAVVCFGLADRFAPPGTVVEAITVITAASLGAFAVGTACAGLVVDRFDPGAGFLAATATGLGVLALITLRRRTLPLMP